MSSVTIHLIGNAHLDPVWLWDWREGFNEGIATIRTILDLMEEDPGLTFIRGEASIYQHVQKYDPESFLRIRQHFKNGRWDIVGGTVVQPDTNLPSTQTLLRQFVHGQNYFLDTFGFTPKAGWAADSFGHSAGLPEILAASGITSFAFTRPFPKDMPLSKPAFWWIGSGGSRILSYRPETGWYGAERDEIPKRLDSILTTAHLHNLNNIACFYGLGNHGGGPSRRHLADIKSWVKKHPEIRVVHSGLHRFFAALEKEARAKGASFLPEHHGEMNFSQRGCYVSVAKFKAPYRLAEGAVVRAEKTNSIIAAVLRRPGGNLNPVWDSVLFNSFHDILPGSSIERAFDDQIAWISTAQHESQKLEFASLNLLAGTLDTRVAPVTGDHPTAVPFVLWNPHPFSYEGHVELEACLDYRFLWTYKNRVDMVPLEVRNGRHQSIPFQTVKTEHDCAPHLPWRKRVVIRVKLAPFGYEVFDLGWVEGAKQVTNFFPHPAAQKKSDYSITNGFYTVSAKPGAKGISITRQGKSWIAGKGLHAITVEDPWGSWGAMNEEPEGIDLSDVRHEWKISQVQVLESGPERASLWVRLIGGNSRLDLTFQLYTGRDAVDVSVRVFWNERSARLKLVFPVGDQVTFQVPGGEVTRDPAGEVPGGRWLKIKSPNPFGLASNYLYGFDAKDGNLRASVIRASRYAHDYEVGRDETPWIPAVDAGEIRFQFLLTANLDHLQKLSTLLEQPVLVQMVAAKKGPRPRQGGFAELSQNAWELLTLRRASDGRALLLTVQSHGTRTLQGKLHWLGSKLDLGSLAPGKIGHWRLIPQTSHRWKIERVFLPNSNAL